MKMKIRSGLFETNSSSEHSLVLMNRDSYIKWERGDLYARVKSNTDDGNTWGNFWSCMYELEFTGDSGRVDEENAALFEKIRSDRLKSLERYKSECELHKNDTDAAYRFNEGYYVSEKTKWSLMTLELYIETEMSIDDRMWMTHDEFYESYIRKNDCDSPFEHDSAEQNVHIIGNYYHS